MIPIVQVVSIHSTHDATLQNPVLNVVSKAFRTLDIPWGPYVPDIKLEHLPGHIKDTNPDLVVLVLEYEDFIDVLNVNRQIKLFRDLLTSVKNSESAKLFLIVTSDKDVKNFDASSSTVRNYAQKINADIVDLDKVQILSWACSPSQIHRDVIVDLLRAYKSKTSDMLFSLEKDANGQECLRNRVIIQDGCVLAVLNSKPPDWLSHEGWLGPMSRQKERTEVEIWENRSGIITTRLISAAPMLRKVVENGPTERGHSFQGYCYHSKEETFNTINKFLQGLDLGPGADHRNIPSELKWLLQDIVIKHTEIILLSLDIETIKDLQSIEELVLFEYWIRATRALASLKGFIIILIGDLSYRAGNLVSDSAIQLLHPVDQLLSTAGFPLETEKITVMSWREKPSTVHKTKLKNILSKSPSTANEDFSKARESVVEKPTARGRTLPDKTIFDPVNGYLRYRAELERGRVVKVIVRNPADWHPSIKDLHLIAESHGKVSKAVVDIWADSHEGPTKEPIVIEEKTSWFERWPFLWNRISD